MRKADPHVLARWWFTVVELEPRPLYKESSELCYAVSCISTALVAGYASAWIRSLARVEELLRTKWCDVSLKLRRP